MLSLVMLNEVKHLTKLLAEPTVRSLTLAPPA